MGAWGEGLLENDDAMDWLADLEATGDGFTVRDALDDVATTPPDEYLDADVGQQALVAAELVAAAAGRPASGQPDYERIVAWARENPGVAELLDLARRAVERADGGESEIRDLWLEEDDGGAGAWFRGIADLKGRLAA
jgi:hypothetical protein